MRHSYINRRTGAVIETESLCAGGDWQELEPPEKKKRQKKEAKNGKLRDDRGPADSVEESDQG